MAKWGKIGSPKSAKRRAWLASLRRRKGGSSRKSSSKKTRRKTTKKRRRRSNPVAKKTKRRNFKIPITIALPLAAGPFIPPGPPGWDTPFNGAMAGMWDEAFRTAMVSYTFFDPGKRGVTSEGFKWDGGNALKVLIIGALIHKFVGGWPLNLNRMLARAFPKSPVNI